jgi:tetratricopeptide (TPR) repeat protein
MARKAAAATNAAPAARVRLALCLARLSWTYVANAEYGATEAPYRVALAAIDPLVESDPARYGPLRSWLLSERAFAEGMEGRFRESAADLQEAGLLWARYAPADDPGCEAQRFVLATSLGGMLHAMGDTNNAVTATSRAAEELDSILFPDEPAEGSGDAVPRSLADLLAGCYYRLGEFHRKTGGRIASAAAYRRASELWRDLFKAHGEGYRLACAQALGRLAPARAELDQFDEAVAAWDEMRVLLAPLLVSDPARYRPVVADILRNSAEACRRLGDETRALALESEAAALAQP